MKLSPEVAGAMNSGRPEAVGAIARDHPELLYIGTMVGKSVDERDVVSVRMGQARFADLSPNVTIAPTLACNFRCAYCDQPAETRAQTITDEIAEAIVAYIDKRLDSIEQFSVTWYGGEPLLVLPRLMSMQKAILSLCGKRGIGVITCVVTNGWFLDAPTAKRLAEVGIRQVQVTLDGPPEVHNSRRPTRNGDHTFDRILGNVQAAQEYLDVRLRVNVDGDNASGLLALLDLLENSGLTENVYLAPIVCYEASCAGIQTPFQNGTTIRYRRRTDRKSVV